MMWKTENDIILLPIRKTKCFASLGMDFIQIVHSDQKFETNINSTQKFPFFEMIKI